MTQQVICKFSKFKDVLFEQCCFDSLHFLFVLVDRFCAFTLTSVPDLTVFTIFETNSNLIQQKLTSIVPFRKWPISQVSIFKS
uniref:Uncharacterized protein n=1 Tax=Anguilla anguilla TaxID=7936 RepID=A0A0E9WUG0_ANGAN